ncbi:FxLYD domain-containing protein [Phormidesmis sp. 146-35]
MLKRLLIAIALLPILTEQAIANPIALSADPPLCYMQTSGGKMLNLSALCSQSDQVSNLRSSSFNMVASAVNYDGNLITGQVTNQSDQVAKSITVNYEIQDEQGKEIDAGFVKSDTTAIAPGQSIPFQTTSNHPGAKVQIISIDWDY